MALRYHNGSITAEAIYNFFFGSISKLFNIFYVYILNILYRIHCQNGELENIVLF